MADDTLMVYQGKTKFIDITNIQAYYRALWKGSTGYTWSDMAKSLVMMDSLFMVIQMWI
jgi:hypothetical protein